MQLELKNIQSSIGIFYINDLAAFVHTGFRVDAVRDLCFPRIFIQVKLRCRQGIMSAALARARM
jgi:hypothetical protein